MLEQALNIHQLEKKSNQNKTNKKTYQSVQARKELTVIQHWLRLWLDTEQACCDSLDVLRLKRSVSAKSATSFFARWGCGGEGGGGGGGGG